MNYNYVIIEDNPKAIENLRLFMKTFPQFVEKGVAHELKKGVLLILEQKPDLIFLDVELEQGSGFDLVRELALKMISIPEIIFTTSHDFYAIQAIKIDALYFLSKPIDPDELEIALLKFEKKYLETRTQLIIKNSEGHFFIDFNNIILLMSDGNYTYIFQEDLKTLTVAKSLNDIESQLPKSFLKIHKSYIINSSNIEMLNTRLRKIIISSKNPLTHINNKIFERGNKTECENNGVSNQSIDQASKNDFKVVLPVGKTYFEKVKNTLFDL